MTTAQENRVAATILEQLGGRKFLAMTGSKNLLDTGNGLRMNLAKNITSANRLQITLNAMDTYEVKFYRMTLNRKTLEAKITTLAEYEGVYADQLQEIFTEVTGLLTRLF